MRWLRPSGSPRLTQPGWPDPPRNSRWTVTHAERVEVRDAGGALVVWHRVDRKLSGLRDQADRLVMTFVPGVAQLFAPRNLLESAVEGALLGPGATTNATRGGGTLQAPALNLRDLSMRSVVAAAVVPDDPAYQVQLLPTGRLNERAMSRAIDLDTIARLRALSPLSLSASPAGMELVASDGRVFGRASYEDPAAEQPSGVEVLDNDLPGHWLYGIFLGAHQWHS